MIRLQLKDREGTVLGEWTGDKEIRAVADREYQAGDCLVLSGARHFTVQLDPCLPEAEVFAPQGCMHWTVPAGDDRQAYAPGAFYGTRHLLSVRETPAFPGEKRLSENSHDLRGDTDFFPHATANVETRNEACFAARSVIDGVFMNHGHGEWPYESWGIGTRQDAALTLDFGRPVEVERLEILSRADFPHDSWFTSLTVHDDSGRETKIHLEKTDLWQSFDLKARTNCLRFDSLEKADDPSPFPSLRGIRVYGRER